jgi:hypothetical protein
MPRISYVAENFRDSKLATIATARQICEEYERQGYELTLRQLYYQFVARGLIPNSQREYKNLGTAVNDGRMAGLIDWLHIVDRTRSLVRTVGWDSPADVIYSAARGYTENLWAGQEWHVEVWVEKEALAGVVQRPAQRYQVPWFCCRGYVSQSEMWGAARRIRRELNGGHQRAAIIHLGDHDPSGLDMTRDIQDRLLGFGASVRVVRVALNLDQVEDQSPPPNPAKLTDSRAEGYISDWGDQVMDESGEAQSWELDALQPAYLDDLIDREIRARLDRPMFDARVAEVEERRSILTQCSERWDEVVDFLEGS